MIQTRIDGVSFWAVNTDAQALAKSLAPNVLNIGRRVTRGLGAGGVPLVGRRSAEENAAEIKSICRGSDMIFITAGMGGGTGSGAGPVVAEIARDEGCLTVGVVTKPFAFEGKRRMQQAEAAIAELRKHVDTLIVVSNDKLLRIVPENTPVTDAFLVADDILRQGVVGISEIIIKTGLVNVDFADVRAVMTDAAVAAISSPLLDFPISEAKRIVFNVVGGTSLGLSEINAASEVIYENAHEDANIIFGALIDPDMGEEVSITVLACDFRESTGPSTSARAVVAGVGGARVGGVTEVARNGEGEYRSPNFYKDRREMTRSPLGPDASIEETRTAITRGFKRPVEPAPPAYLKEEEDERKSFRKRKGGFFRRLFGSSWSE
jgi:cell division protein FtsZ